MINKKILMSGFSIVASLSLMGGAAFAFFSSNATSTDNTFASGTMTLLVDDVNELTPVPSVTGSLSISGFVPGDSTSGFISLHNGGSIDMEKVKMTASATLDDGADNLGDIRDFLNLDIVLDDGTPDTACVGGTSLNSAIDPEVGNGGGSLTLKEFNDGGDDEFDAILEGAPVLTAGATRNVCIIVTFSSLADDTVQGDSSNVTFGFTGLQEESQL